MSSIHHDNLPHVTIRASRIQSPTWGRRWSNLVNVHFVPRSLVCTCSVLDRLVASLRFEYTEQALRLPGLTGKGSASPYWRGLTDLHDHHLSLPHPDLTFTSPLPSLGSVRWLSSKEVRPTLKAVYRSWQQSDGTGNLESFAAIQYELWAAQYGSCPEPDICLISSESHEEVLGVMAGFRRYGHKDFFVQSMAIHPLYAANETASHMITHRLLEAAMDESISMGCYGWVSCAPDSHEVEFWRYLGFSRYDDFTFKRMGYFH